MEKNNNFEDHLKLLFRKLEWTRRKGTTYSGVIESESEEGQLKTEILGRLRCPGLDFLQIIVLEEPVYELWSDLFQSFLRQHVIRAPNLMDRIVRFPWIGICEEHKSINQLFYRAVFIHWTRFQKNILKVKTDIIVFFFYCDNHRLRFKNLITLFLKKLNIYETSVW